jgi:Na+/H+-dicarboxylate symporter
MTESIDNTHKPRFSPTMAWWALGAMALGTVLGMLGRAQDLAFIQVIADIVTPLGALWLQSLQMVVVPLVITQLLAALVRPTGNGGMGNLGGRTLVVFLCLSVGTAVFMWFSMTQALGFFEVREGIIESLQSQVIPPAIREAGAMANGGGVGDWLLSMVPRNPLQAMVDGDILQILVFVILLGLALGKLPDEQRDPLARVARTLADGIMILVSWILWGMPVGVFALMLSLTLGAGLSVVGLVGLYFLIVTSLMVVVSVLVYPVAVIFGRVGLRRFAKGALPGQIVAATTQSSLASLPALIEGGQDHLDMKEGATGFVLPLCVAMFKLNQSASPMAKMLFLAYFLGIDITMGQVVFFAVGAIALGLATPGIPRGSNGAAVKLPLYLAVGIPIEGYVMMEPVKHIPIYDAAATILNVTGDMGAATILSVEDRA